MTLDDLLAQPLPPVADDGFSVRVLAALRAEEQRRWAVAFATIIAAVVVCMLALPLPALSLAFGRAVFALGNEAAVSLAVGICVVTFLVERAIARR